MARAAISTTFSARLLRPARMDDGAPWAFVVLPRNASAALPRRGRTSVTGSLHGHGFQATLEPDGQLSHWLRLEQALLDAAGVTCGDEVQLVIAPPAKEPEPALPADWQQALAAVPAARATWDATTTLARVDWIHWLDSAKQADTRTSRIANACDMLAGGKRRVCCFDTSGYYSKAFAAPEALD